MAQPNRTKKTAKPAGKPAARRAAPVAKKAARPLRERKLGSVGQDPPRGQ